jgi:hypothetical protein
MIILLSTTKTNFPTNKTCGDERQKIETHRSKKAKTHNTHNTHAREMIQKQKTHTHAQAVARATYVAIIIKYCCYTTDDSIISITSLGVAFESFY